MATTSLYRKYRPKTFDDVIGQGSIIKSLKKQLENNAPTHAYLFYGDRGLGKTTTARIFAASLGIKEEDLYEIDAASNRGIDDIRQIKEGVSTRPFSSPYKMYLIDEVHMLTKEAFNALLKTLEEPPSYVIFIMATTELHKVPITIKSRSQLYTFNKATDNDIKKLINKVAAAESIKLSDEDIQTLVQNAAGSYRDALSELQRFTHNNDDYQSLAETQTLADKVVKSIVDGDLSALRDVLQDINSVSNYQLLYNAILKTYSNNFYNELQDSEDSKKYNSVVLKIILQSRHNFSSSDTLLQQQAGIRLLLAQLIEFLNSGN